jgi:hypothetical protein
MAIFMISGCVQPQQPVSHSVEPKEKYRELSEVAIQENDLVNIGWYKNPQDSDKIINVLLESEIAAIVEGSVRYSIEVRSRDVDKARTILMSDERLQTLSITIEP